MIKAAKRGAWIPSRDKNENMKLKIGFSKVIYGGIFEKHVFSIQPYYDDKAFNSKDEDIFNDIKDGKDGKDIKDEKRLNIKYIKNNDQSQISIVLNDDYEVIKNAIRKYKDFKNINDIEKVAPAAEAAAEAAKAEAEAAVKEEAIAIAKASVKAQAQEATKNNPQAAVKAEAKTEAEAAVKEEAEAKAKAAKLNEVANVLRKAANELSQQVTDEAKQNFAKLLLNIANEFSSNDIEKINSVIKSFITKKNEKGEKIYTIDENNTIPKFEKENTDKLLIISTDNVPEFIDFMDIYPNGTEPPVNGGGAKKKAKITKKEIDLNKMTKSEMISKYKYLKGMDKMRKSELIKMILKKTKN